MTVLSSWLWWRVEGHSSHMLPGPVPAHNCVASTGLDGAEQTAWHWSHTGSGPSTLVTLVVVSSLPPASTCSHTLGRLRLACTWPPQETQETQEPGEGRGVLVVGRALQVPGSCSGVLSAAMVPQPSFVINKLTPLQLQHLGPATSHWSHCSHSHYSRDNPTTV